MNSYCLIKYENIESPYPEDVKVIRLILGEEHIKLMYKALIHYRNIANEKEKENIDKLAEGLERILERH